MKREFNGNTMVTKYEGTVNGDELKLKITRTGQDGTPDDQRSDRQAVHHVVFDSPVEHD